MRIKQGLYVCVGGLLVVCVSALAQPDTPPSYLTQWGPLNLPLDIAADAQSNVYVIVDYFLPNSRIMKFTSDGTLITE